MLFPAGYQVQYRSQVSKWNTYKYINILKDGEHQIYNKKSLKVWHSLLTKSQNQVATVDGRMSGGQDGTLSQLKNVRKKKY